MPFVKSLSTKTQLTLVAIGYAAVLLFGAGSFYQRRQYELQHQADVSAAGGMFAAGDAMLAIFVACLLMIPTFYLVWIGAKFERAFTIYARALVVVGLSAPLCLGLLFLGDKLPQS